MEFLLPVAFLTLMAAVFRSHFVRNILAQRLGLTYIGTFDRGTFTRGSMFGSLEGVGISVSFGAAGVEIAVMGGEIPRDLELWPAGMLASALNRSPDERIQRQELGIDLAASGPEAQRRACLRSEVSHFAAAALGRWGARLEAQKISLRTLKSLSSRDLERCLRELVDLARKLGVPGHDLRRQIEENASSDPDIAVRRQCLEYLQRVDPESPETVAASRAALGSHSREMRLVGGCFLGDEGRQTVAALVADATTAGRLRAEGIAHLAASCPDQLGASLLALIADPDSETAAAAIKAAGSLRHAAAMPALLARVESADTRIGVQLAHALARLRDARAETALLRLLAHADDAVQRAAAEALGHVGSVGAVERMLELQHASRGDTRRSLQSAIQRIQVRLGSPGSGRMSLASAAQPDGGLSLPEDGAEGQLSVTEAPGEDAEGRERE